ncbi:MAG: DNA/RNA nuclease SfsA [Christensenellales bacterium]|jgi:sugar fermentation stimulation protein A
MRYDNICDGVFISRPNRFVALAEIDGAETLCHVKNTGRLGELLIPGVALVIQRVNSSGRKTSHDLIGVKTEKGYVNIDSQAPNKLFEEWLLKGLGPIRPAEIKREHRYLSSRLDFLITGEGGERHLVETKGVTLIENGVALFPDAPTERGVRHLEHLAQAASDGFVSWAVFIVKADFAHGFSPNEEKHPGFAQALRSAQKSGVNVLALSCDVTREGIFVREPLPVML